MAASHEPSPAPRIPIARMRSLYRLDAVSQRLAKLQRAAFIGAEEKDALLVKIRDAVVNI